VRPSACKTGHRGRSSAATANDLAFSGERRTDSTSGPRPRRAAGARVLDRQMANEALDYLSSLLDSDVDIQCFNGQADEIVIDGEAVAISIKS
jgi:hypothetical protein